MRLVQKTSWEFPMPDGVLSVTDQATAEYLENLVKDAERCEFIRCNPYRAMDIFGRLDVDRPALWRQQFNELIDAAMKGEL